jgi:hypothetical protein
MTTEEIDNQRVKEWRELNIVQDLEFCWRMSGVPGVRVVEAIHPSWSCPIGMAYVQDAYDRSVQLSYINVVEQLRRLGVGRAIVREIQREYPEQRMVTSVATALASPFLKKLNWKEPSWCRPYWCS